MDFTLLYLKTVRLATCCMLSVLWCFAANADAPCLVSNNTHRLSLSHAYTQGGVRVFYDVQGDHKIPTTSDQNNNSVPDVVEDIALHAALSRGVFNAVGFADPLRNPRFSASEYIDIELLNFSLYRPAVASNRGFAFSGQYTSSKESLRRGGCSLMIVLNTNHPEFDMMAKDFLIPHEVFHLYQYAYTEFKQAWLHEGLAKWAERATQNRPSFDVVRSKAPLPSDVKAFVNDVLQHPNPYATQGFWVGLLSSANLADDVCRIPQEWRLVKFSDGTPVIRNTQWRGCATVQKLYASLQQRASRMSAANGRKPYAWSEAQRRTPQCNRVIADALLEAIGPSPPDTTVGQLRTVLSGFVSNVSANSTNASADARC